KALALQLGRDGVGLLLEFEIARLKLHAVALELGHIVLGCAERLAFRQQEIASIAVTDLDDVAHLAEPADAFEQDDLHGFYSFIGQVCRPWRAAAPSVSEHAGAIREEVRQ